MEDLLYGLQKQDYSWENALLWGNFAGHCKKASVGSLGSRVVHVLIAAVELLPIISQIISIVEKLIATLIFSSTKSLPAITLPPEEKDPLFIPVTEKTTIVDDIAFNKAIELIDTPEKLEEYPKFNSGRSTVYEVKDLGVVVKRKITSNKKPIEHLVENSHKATALCKENAYSCLIVPPIKAYKNYVIQTRLPIDSYYHTKTQMGFYLDHIKEFDQAVEEFTKFLCHADLGDITGTTDPYSKLSKRPIGKYDNVAMYMQDGKGELGLIDLDIFRIRKKVDVFRACQEAIYLFPHHYDVIMKAASEIDPNIEKRRIELLREKQEALRFFKFAYQDHLTFIQKNDITLKTATEIFPVTLNKQKLLSTLENNDDLSLKDYLGSKVKDAKNELKFTAFSQIFNAINMFLERLLQDNLMQRKISPSSNGDLLAIRSVTFTKDSSHYKELQQDVIKSLNCLTFTSEEAKISFADKTINIIFKELEKDKQISRYIPNFDHLGSCIFC